MPTSDSAACSATVRPPSRARVSPSAVGMAANVTPLGQVRNCAGLGTVNSAGMLRSASPIRLSVLSVLLAAVSLGAAASADARLPGGARYAGETEEGRDV